MDRELDRQIAAALGWVDFWESRDGDWLMGYPPVEQGAGIDAERHPVPAFSTDLAAAWQLIDHLRAQGWLYGIGDIGTDTHECTFFRDGSGPRTAEGDTPAAAIVAAFLAAMETT